MTDSFPPVKMSELLEALEFVSAGEDVDAAAYINLAAGAVHWTGEGIDPEDENLPEDVAAADGYISIPHRRDLDLGSRLVFAFADEVMPGEYDTIRDIFRRRGAYRRFKDFLSGRGLLGKWYAFEERATEAALRRWCEESGIDVAEDTDRARTNQANRPTDAASRRP